MYVQHHNYMRQHQGEEDNERGNFCSTRLVLMFSGSKVMLFIVDCLSKALSSHIHVLYITLRIRALYIGVHSNEL